MIYFIHMQFQSITDKFHRMYLNQYTDIKFEYDFVLNEYKEKTKSLNENYYILKEKYGNDLQKKYKASIQKLLVS